jgi:DNA repair protein RadD
VIILRDYQDEGVGEIRAAYKAGFRSVLYVLSTGGGKSAVFNYIGGSVSAKGFKVCVVVHRDELLHQNIRSFEAQDIPYGVIAPGHSTNPVNVQIASVWSLSRPNRLVKWPHFDMIIFDEAHHLAAASFEKVYAAYPKALKLSVTATPQRLDGVGLGGYCDKLIMGPPMRTLIERGYLAACDVYGPPTDLDLTQVHTRMGDFIAKELEGAMDKPTITGSAVEHYKRLAMNQPAVAFCVSIRHCEHVAEQFKRAGFAAASIDGRMDTPQRQRLISDLSSGALKVLTSCQLLTEGVDVPACRDVILLRPTQSVTLFLQMVGRGMRPKPDGMPMILQDHVGNCIRHGLPDNEREWSLEGRKRSARDEEQAPAIRVCEFCFTIFSATAERCPKCKAMVPKQDRQIEEVDGELVRLTPEEALRQRWKQERLDPNVKLFKDLSEDEEQEWERQQRDQLSKIAREKGYKPGWINIVLAKRRAARKSAQAQRRVA